MNIEAKHFTLEMTHNELWSTAFDVRNALYASFKDHWVNHQNAWQENEKQRMYRLKNLFLALGRPDLYDEIPVVAKDIFEAFNKKNKS